MTTTYTATWYDSGNTSTTGSVTFSYAQTAYKPLPVVAAVPKEMTTHRRQTALLYFYRRGPGAGGGYDGNKHLVEVEFINVTDLMAKFFIKAWTEVKQVDNWRHYCIGLGSLLPSGLHMPMLDYDVRSLRTVSQHTRRLQKNFQLGPATLYSTKKGYHVYFTGTPVNWPTYSQILDDAKCDPKFRAMSQQNHIGVLRISAKYTQFDIQLADVLEPKGPSALARTSVYARVADTLIGIGRECGTHIASVFPNQAKYKEDLEEWKAPRKKVSSAEMYKTLEFIFGHTRIRHHANGMLDVRRSDGTNFVYSFSGHSFLPARPEDAAAVMAYQQWLAKCLKKAKPSSINVGVIRVLYQEYWKLPAYIRAKLPPKYSPKVFPLHSIPGENPRINAEYPDGSQVVVSVKDGWVPAALTHLEHQNSYGGEPLPDFMDIVDAKPKPMVGPNYLPTPVEEEDMPTENIPEIDPGVIEDIGGGVSKCSYPDGSWVKFKIKSGWTEYSPVGQAMTYLRSKSRWTMLDPFPSALELIEQMFSTPIATNWYEEQPKAAAFVQNFKIDYASLEKHVIMNTGANWVIPKNEDGFISEGATLKYGLATDFEDLISQKVAKKILITKNAT